MPTHDYVIDNQTAPNFRADLNQALQAIVSNNSSTSAPTTTYANMIWYDATNNLLRMRSEADDAWITLGTLNQVSNTFSVSGIDSSTLASGTADSTTFLRGDRTWQQVTSYTDAQARTAQAGHSAGEIGSYAFLRDITNSSTNIAQGTLVAGSSLRYSGTYYRAAIPAQRGQPGVSEEWGIFAQGDIPAGTWRLMGYGQRSSGTGTTRYASLFLRVS